LHLVSVDRVQQLVGLGEVFKHFIGSRAGQFGDAVAARLPGWFVGVSL
jgi:hypothetical protein